MDKLNYSNIVEEIRVIHVNSGWEYIVEDVNIFTRKNDETIVTVKRDFAPKRPYPLSDVEYHGMTKDEARNTNAGMKIANKELAFWKKGVRALIKIAKRGPGAMERIGNTVHGNGAKNTIDYFWRLYKTISNEDIIKMGETKKNPSITSYIDGSYDYSL